MEGPTDPIDPIDPTQAERMHAYDRLTSEHFDVLVIGGGITGAGVALDAATRGLRVAVVDRDDWASGTSSKSSKLVHGGLRYLQQKEYRLVYENLRERQRLLHNAPHLVHVMPFLIPLFGSNAIASKALTKAYGTALTLYDMTGGWRIGKLHRRISADETVAHMGGLSRARVAAGFLYYDAQADDARLTLAIIRTAQDHGAIALNHCAVDRLTCDTSGMVDGAVLAPDGSRVRARVVVNAAGVWSESIASSAGAVSFRLRPAKGCHITVPFDKVRSDIAAVVPVKRDRRSVFVVPAFDAHADGAATRIYIGTTDTDYDGPLNDVTCTPDDVRYLLDAVNEWLDSPLAESDVIATWAGLRPLLGDARSERSADLSRRHKVVVGENGLVSILGGKLTTYREMAEATVDVVAKRLRVRARSRTARLPLHGAAGASDLAGDAAATKLGITPDLLKHLASRHGSDAADVAALITDEPTLAAPLVAGLPYIGAEVVHAVRREQARTIDDVLSRRTRALLLDLEATAAAAPSVAALMTRELGWSSADVQRECDAFEAIVVRERAPLAATRGRST